MVAARFIQSDQIICETDQRRDVGAKAFLLGERVCLGVQVAAKKKKVGPRRLSELGRQTGISSGSLLPLP